MPKIRTFFIYLLFASVQLLHANVPAQGHWLKVKSKNSNQPIEGVSVTVNDVFVATTGPLGRVFIEEMGSEDVVSFFHTSYAPRHYDYRQLVRSNFTVGLYESVLNIQEVVIKANRIEAEFKYNPQEVRTLSSKRMSTQFIGNSADALALDPNVFIQKSQSGGGSPMIRGMSTSRVLILIDGMRLNNAIFRSGNVHNVINLDPLTISDMEISLGPGSVLHGSDALGGTMHINTYDAHYGDSSEVLQSLVYDFSSNNMQLVRRPNFRLNYGGSNWAGMTSITYSQYRDVQMGSQKLPWTSDTTLSTYQAMCEAVTFGTLDTMRKPLNPIIQTRTAYEQRNITQKLKYRLTDLSEIKLGIYLSQVGEMNRFDRFIETYNNAPKYAHWNYAPQLWSMASLAYENRARNRFYDRARLSGALQGYQEGRDTRRFRSNIGRFQQEQVFSAQSNFDANKKINQRLLLSYGGDINYNRVQSEAHHYWATNKDSIWSAQTRYADGSKWMSTALFASGIYSLKPELSLSAGLRANHIYLSTPQTPGFTVEDMQWNFVAPSASLGASYSKENFKYFLNLSTGFRAPNVDDASKVFDSQPGAVIVPNVNLREERLYSAEVGLKRLLSDFLVLDASFYYSYLNNAMVRAPFSINGQDSLIYDGELSQIMALQNQDYATIWGYQFGVRTEFSSTVFWTLHWAHPFGRDSNNEPMRHVSPFNATSQLSYRKNRLTATLTARYNGAVDYEDLSLSERSKPHIYAVDQDGNPYSPRWYTLGIMTNYELNKNILLRLGVDNLMDIRYRPYSSGIVAPGRALFIGLRGSI